MHLLSVGKNGVTTMQTIAIAIAITAGDSQKPIHSIAAKVFE